MRPLSPEELNDFATTYGLSAAVAQRDYVAVRVARAIASDRVVAEEISLKGGFALRYGYGSPRTSKDIDGTIGTKHDAVDPKRIQRLVRGQCSDLQVRFDPRDPTLGVDSLDFGNIGYVRPLGGGFLTLEMSYRGDLILPPRHLLIDAFGVAPFRVRALAVDEMIAEKWRCLVQRSPRKPGDPYDLWFLWERFRKTEPRSADDSIDDAQVRRLVPLKVDLRGGSAAMIAAVDQYRRVWPAAIGDTLPTDAPSYQEVRAAILEAAGAWAPWR
ncbi:MAG: nucleotidyl transferase AbiEii/AbiGii toxin family protein [Candidatus Limnocylindrales bacterium]|jgi:hypothetical protein